MDRFIEQRNIYQGKDIHPLKSNMDRFIGAPRDCLVLIDEIFKIQYG